MLHVARPLVAIAMIVGPCVVSAHAAFISSSHLRNVHAKRIAYDAPALPPVAHSRFCLQYPADCEIRRIFKHRDISLTSARWDELAQVNRDVNRAIIPQRNLGGVLTEEWLLAPKTGDCNDYAVTKRHQLLERGWPSRALILSEVVTGWGEHHLVLVVRMREGDFVLDSLSPNILPAASVRYRWVRAQSPANPKFWSSISIAPSVPIAPPERLEFHVAYRLAGALRRSSANECLVGSWADRWFKCNLRHRRESSLWGPRAGDLCAVRSCARLVGDI
jgi:predicted transglutaminase-like cysteine proteinase